MLKGTAPQPAQGGEEKKYPVMLGSKKAIPITGAKTSVDIALPAKVLHSLALSPAGSQTSELVLRDITAQSEPGTMLNVYVAKKGKPTARQYVGTVNWFGAFEHHEAMDSPDRKTLQFDITDQLRALGIASATSGLTVTFEADNGRVAKNSSKAPALKAQAEPAVRSEAKVQIGAIEVRQGGVLRRKPELAEHDGTGGFSRQSLHHRRTRSAYSGCFSTYSSTAGQIMSTLRLFSRAHWKAPSARDDARPIPRNFSGISVWVRTRTLSLKLYSR